MHTAFFHHPACLDHDTGAGHPERSDRLRAILAALETETFQLLDRRKAPMASEDALCAVHPADYVEQVLREMPEEGYRLIDGDTVTSPGTREAALRAAGGGIAAVDAVLSGEVRNAFSAGRPPGHHAERRRAMGFCFFNNAVVAAAHARSRYGAERVAVIDFDVHHGNGTQDFAWDDAALFYASTHQAPLFPGTGRAEETGAHDTIFNVPLRAGADGSVLIDAMRQRVLPALSRFSPDLVIISAGFDGHRRDPLAGLALETEDYGAVTRAILETADQVCGGRVVSVLEGGYDLEALAESCAAHVTELMAG